uniref:Uncharacterized protein n=1 Tax=Octopus bimaculoides TaxID=37653 RepID=A0A0L8FYZ5_OCTBM
MHNKLSQRNLPSFSEHPISRHTSWVSSDLSPQSLSLSHIHCLGIQTLLRK